MPKLKQQMPTPVRLPDDLKAWVKATADGNLRSMSAEIVAILMAERKRQEKQPTNN
jgi:hypothetical protein